MNHEETIKIIDQEIRKLKNELSQLERARRSMKKKGTEMDIIW